MNQLFDTYCGLVCDGCEFIASCGCKGCIASEGHPFHGSCAVAKCAKSKKRRFCGECADFPCDLLRSYSFDPVHGDNGKRIERCKAIKQALVRQGREGVDPIGVCGHHCDHCFMAAWCGGCRSAYNCCSYGTLFEDSTCPNVSCASSKGLTGCWECEALDGCTTGFFGLEGKFAAKSTAQYIRLHGKEAYSRGLAQAIHRGFDYEHALDEAGSVENAFALLEKHLY